ncbi:glycosyltransferase [Occallatibacter savannae]|uniref:glycosyltransferase n=1 Tax=Occallatibacter savannae TaxID=1002691 RepID=UPI000D69B491|nr:glycosyltransferase [Occallatibacter savannae]
MSEIRPVFTPEAKPLKVMVVIVLYKIRAEDSPAFRSVIAARESFGRNAGEVRVLLWDNSPVSGASENLPEGVAYFGDESNSGLATAYNRAMEWAELHGAEWLLTLDQDTAVPPDFFHKMGNSATAATQYAGVGAIVPQIAASGRRLSPNWFQFGAVPRWYRTGYVGVPAEPVFAFNSGAMLRLDALKQAGGYDPRFWLDNSDAMIFSKLHEHGKRVYVAGDIQVEHEFSMKDMQRRMSAVRYENALFAETAFWDLRMNRIAGWERTLRLVLRLFKHWARGDAAELRRITWHELMRRLFTPRRTRVKEWVEATEERAKRAQRPMWDPRISVCMASYNGGPYVDAQLQSILSQLGPNDEVVIVDDGSTDDTVLRIEEIADARVKLLRHRANAGVLATFEDALRCGTGEILFLADDDDVWAPTKVQRFMEVFSEAAGVGIVSSRVRMIDEHDRPLADSRINRSGKFRSGFWWNLFINHYQGSAMAVRASLLGQVLPFPAQQSFLHDAWIGTRNDLLGGKAVFIEQDLLFYRRHSKNASRTKPLTEQIRTRVELLLAHLSYWFLYPASGRRAMQW